jgi:serine/threonine-protein kinase
MLGAKIGGYQITSLLGEGGMGTVYLGEHVLLGRRAAIKVLLPMYSTNAEVVGRFFTEARAITRVADPGIVQVYDFGMHDDGSAYLVMELLDGESLADRIARLDRLAPLHALQLAKQCAASLATAHAKGIVHRDLKPENLFIVGDTAVTGGERVKILDFGIAKLSNDNNLGVSRTRTGTVIGTPIYMAPEQCRAAGDIDHRCDVYSLGCVTFAMLAGRAPFVYDSAGELIAAHLREQPPSLVALAGVPEPIDALVQKCLAKSPSERFPSMTALLAALEEAAAATPQVPATRRTAPTTPANITTLGAAASEAVRRPLRGGRVLVVGVVAALCSGGAIFAIAAHTRPAGRPALDAPESAIDAAPARDAMPPPDAATVIDAAPPIDAPTAAVPIDAAPVQTTAPPARIHRPRPHSPAPTPPPAEEEHHVDSSSTKMDRND